MPCLQTALFSYDILSIGFFFFLQFLFIHFYSNFLEKQSAYTIHSIKLKVIFVLKLYSCLSRSAIHNVALEISLKMGNSIFLIFSFLRFQDYAREIHTGPKFQSLPLLNYVSYIEGSFANFFLICQNIH